ncbi:hypothetical protein [Alicyclobacillus sp. ALC3]|uniref:hypothetical protein n=1 Tax=Alicyclobacillus sp. ALC3 TaxID=2796143 RepID=UPI00237959F9|nr:hypothetical protein [Alicyclobacillus sp. ALC3]WDL96947.1 hypothetical protein JC200_22155 [Alicyclobacillus sp. ALC3]
MRIDLSEHQSGAWADILDAVPYKVIKVAAAVAKKKDPTQDEEEQANQVLLKTMVRAWNVKDAEGKEVKVPREATVDEIEMVDGFILSKIFTTVTQLVKSKVPDPNSGNASSPS